MVRRTTWPILTTRAMMRHCQRIQTMTQLRTGSTLGLNSGEPSSGRWISKIPNRYHHRLERGMRHLLV